MIKTTVIALVAAVSLAGFAAPAFADTAFGDGSPEMREFAANSILSRLQQQGVNASSVEEWGDLVRAYVTLDDGSQVMQFFTAGSLQPVS
jgi:hypothetical protein